MRLGKIKCAAKVGRLMGGFAALFILRRDSQTALPKIALSLGFCLAVRVALSDRVADNYLIHAVKLPSISVFRCIGAGLFRIFFKGIG